MVVHRRRCGKANCRCAEGVELHESTVLSYSEAGRTKFRMLPPEEVAVVAEAVDRYRAARSAVEEQGNVGLAELIGRLGEGGTRQKGRPQHRGVVYLDAFVPGDGQSTSDLVAADRWATMERIVASEGGGWLVPRFSPTPWDPFVRQAWQVANDSDVRWMLPRLEMSTPSGPTVMA